MTDKESTLRAVLLEPHEDLHRFAYADARADAGEFEQAKLIQMQLACSRAPTRRLKIDFMWQAYLCLHRRWLATPPAPPSLPHVTLPGEPPPRPWKAALGLPKDDPADWLERLRCVSGESWIEYRRGFVERARMNLDGFTKEAAKLFAMHPITGVRLSNRYPSYLNPRDFRNGTCRWYCLERHEPLLSRSDCAALPEDLFDLLPGVAEGASEWQTATVALALDALSDACVEFGRLAAGLPPLP